MLRFTRRWMLGGLTAGVTCGLAASLGCFPRQPDSAPRAQADYDPDNEAFATIGQKTVMGNTDSIPVSAVGLVTGLKGTGSSPPADGWREQLEKRIKQLGLNAKNCLDDPAKTTSLVLISGVIPPGARNGDKFDAMITLPSGSKTTSLDYGNLFLCDLTNYELAGNVRNALGSAGFGQGKVPLAQSSDALIMGSKLATAEGALVTGTIIPAKVEAVEKSDAPLQTDNPSLRVAKVWGGMTNLYDRPYHFLLNGENPQPRLAMVIASRLNTVFHGSGDKAGKVAEAVVKGRPLITVAVPPSYRLNHQRFVQVARNVPLSAPSANDPYRKRLERELLQPETTLLAALKLEALGVDSENSLRVGLEFKESPWVKFASAQALCYLGKADPKAAQILAEVAEKHPSLRTHALTALASQDDGQCLGQLVELMKKGEPALRYGAYQALRSADENHDAVRGRLMAKSYWLHTVAPESDSLVHLTTERRNEIVLFGSVWPITGAFAFPLGTDFTVTRKEGEDSVLVSRLLLKDGEPTSVEARYRADLGVILKGLAEMGGSYANAIEFIRRSNTSECLACKLAVDCLPRSLPLQELAQMARRDPTAAESDKIVANATGLQPGESPELKQAGSFELPSPTDGVRKQPETVVNPGPGRNKNPGGVFENWK